MNLVLSHCFVNVSDPDEALAFYRDVLELEVRTDVSAEGFRWITLSPRSQPELSPERFSRRPRVHAPA